MKPTVSCVAALLALVLGTSGARGEEFLVRLGLKHGHLREVFFGCADGATDGYDRGKDDLAPPRGIQTGYTVFLPPGGKMPPFFKDVRAPGPSVTWEFFAEVFETKAIRISWDRAALPETYDFSILTKDSTVDMRTLDQLELTATQKLTITARARKSKETGKGDG